MENLPIPKEKRCDRYDDKVTEREKERETNENRRSREGDTVPYTGTEIASTISFTSDKNNDTGDHVDEKGD